MRYLEEQYNLLCTKLFQPLGFKKRRNTYIRAVNDIIQKVYLQQSVYGGSYVIGFGMIPLCMELTKEHLTGGVYCLYYLSQLNGEWKWWTYDKNSSDSIDNSLKEVEEILIHKLIPLFIGSESCGSAFDSLCSLERKYYQKRAESAMTKRQDNCIRDYIFMLDEYKRYMALKCKNYDYALESYKIKLQQETEALSSVLNFSPEEVIQRRRASIEAIEHKIARLKAKDYPYFNAMLLANEQNSKALLRRTKLI